MKKKRIGKIIAASLIVVLVAAIFGILKLANVDKYKGLVKINKANLASISTKLSANISDLSEDNNIEVKGYDEIDYNISYRLSEVPGERDVIINAKISESDPYASFKEVTGINITSVLSSDRKEITITLKNLPSNEEITSKVTMLIVNAPKGYTVRPTIRIKESTSEEYTPVVVKEVTVNTSSVQGRVIDEDGEVAPNLLVSLKKNNEIIKETYTNENGIYTFSDITPDTYSVVVNEENYENLEVNNLYIQDGNMLNLIVKKVYPYKIETNKYITKVELNNLGSKKDYLYNDVTLANIPVRKVNNLHGKIYYKITVQNTGEKAGIILSVKDELPEGLSFDEKLNTGYELKNGIIYNRNLEGVELGAGEQISDTLVLTIENTDIAKTYINKVNARGELYEHVVYLLNGRTYKTLDVLEGEKIDEPEVNLQDFSGWYTDEKLTNKYNFNLPVEKDLILYGVTSKKHTVTFVDPDPEDPNNPNPPIYGTPEEVPHGDPVEKPTPDPEKEGYDFCGWTKDNVDWDFNTPVIEDITLVSKYCIKSYKVEFYDKSASNGASYEKIATVSKEYKSTLSNSETPNMDNVWEGHTFLNWTTDQEGQNAYDFATLIKNDIKLYAQYTIQDRLFIFNDENRLTQTRVNYGETVTEIADQGKEGHTFKFWSLTQPSSTETKEPFDFNTPIYTTTTVYAIYQINTFNVVYNDTNPWTNVTEEYDRETVDWGELATKPAIDPEKEGHTFCGWLLNGTGYNFSTPVKSDITLDACYEKNKVTVTFMDGDNLFTTQDVDYGDYATDTQTHPTKEHHIFKYWSEDNTNAYDFANTQIKTPKTLYSVYEEITPPVIEHTPLYWTNDKVLVTISHENANYTFKYKVDDGSYLDYTGPFELETNSTIVAKSVYSEVESTITSHEVTNIDKLNPTIGTLVTTPSFNTITIAGPLSDSQSGIKLVEVYNGNTFVGSVNGTAINAELRDYTKESNLNFTVSNLTQSTEYTFRIVVTDGAGNVTETTVTETTIQPEIICRIISIEGVDLPEQDYIEFPLLASAIADVNCTNKCTIQMLKSTNESVSILNTQDITLDLNGKTVAGIIPGYTVENQGEFTLIDHADTPGGLINNNGIAIFNSTRAKLTLGEGGPDPDPSGPRIVSTTVPYVFGESYGVYSEANSEFAFFDGKIKGTNAVQGEVTETEYTYNASSSDDAPYEVVTLAQLDDPEARINKSRYYTNIADAVTTARAGTSVDTTTQASLLSGFTHTDEKTANMFTNTGYTFIYDADNDTLTSTNDVYGSIAFTEATIDLTGYENDQIFTLLYRVDNPEDISYGSTDKSIQVNVYELNDDYTLESSVSTLSSSSTSKLYKLTKGKKYKVKVSYTQEVKLIKGDIDFNEGNYEITNPSEYSASQMVITNAYLRDNVSSYFEPTLQANDLVLHGFYYDENTDTYRSTNQYGDEYSKAYAFSYIELDLTNKEGDYVLYLDASVEGHRESSAFIHYTTSNEAPPITSASSANIWSIYLSDQTYGKYGPYNSKKIIPGGQKYYIWFGYRKYAYGSGYQDYKQEAFEAANNLDQFIINSIKVVKTDESTTQQIDIPSSLIGNAYDTSNLIDTDGGCYSLVTNNFGEYHDSYVKIDLTSSTTNKIFEINPGYSTYNVEAVYLATSNRGLTVEDINSNRQNMIMIKDDLNSIYTSYTGNGTYMSSWNQSDVKKGYLLEKGNVYYVHINIQLTYKWSSGNGYDCSNSYGDYCGVRLKGLSLTDVEETVFNFGKYKINTGTVDVDGLPEETTTITLSDTSVPTINNRYARSYTYNSESGWYELSEPVPQNAIANFLQKIDLTNETEPQLYRLQTVSPNTGSTYNLLKKDTPPMVEYNDGSLYTGSGLTYLYDGSYITLDPGNVYYFRHVLGTYSYNGSSYIATSDSFKFERVDSPKNTEYTTSSRLISFNENVDEIQILKDISLKDSMVINQNKEAILDLNGYTITSSLSTPIIDNYGKLTIIDSDYEEQTSENKVHRGIIEGTAGHLIQNENNATLIIKNMRLNENTSSSSKYGIYNKGNLVFESDYDSKIYVNNRYGVGIYNDKNGNMVNSPNSLEVVMNYNNQESWGSSIDYGDSYYYQLRTSKINTGIINDGYISSDGLKISGKYGTGLYNKENSVVVLKNANITVDGSTTDIYYDYNYCRNYYTCDREIEDASIINDGNLTLANSTVGARVINRASLSVLNGTSFDWLINKSSYGSIYGNLIAKVDGVLANKFSNYANATLEPNSENGTITINTFIRNSSSGILNLYSFNNTNSSFELTNTEKALLNGFDGNYYNISNQGDASLNLINGTAKHIENIGHDATLNSFTVNNENTPFEEAILSSGILNLGYNVNVIDKNKYAIYMQPKVVEKYDNSWWLYDYTYTYYQTFLNIGTDLEHPDSVNIEGSQYGVTGPCYYKQMNKLTPERYDRDTTPLRELAVETGHDGYWYEYEKEYITQTNYDQTFCFVNFYSGSITGPQEYNKLLDIPVFETSNDSNAHIGYDGIKVTTNNNINTYESGLSEKHYVAQVGDTKYYSIQSAIDSITTDASTTVNVIADNISINSIVIPEGRNITLNYSAGTNTYIYANKGYINNGNLTVTGNGKVVVASKYVYDNNGILSVTNGNYDNITGLYPRESALVNNKGNITVNNGTYNNIDIYNTKNATINGGTFAGTMFYGVGSESNTIVKPNIIKNGNVPTYMELKIGSNNSDINKYNLRHIFELTDGAYASLEDYDTDNDSEYVNSRPIAHIDNATLELKNNNIGVTSDTNHKPVYVAEENGANLIIDNGTYNQFYIHNNGSNVVINDGTINGTSKLDNLVYLRGLTPTIHVTGGNLYSNGNAIGISDFKYYDDNNNIYNDYAYEIYIGTKGDRDTNNDIICSKTSPDITGDAYGIQSYGTGDGSGFLGFYDGIIKGVGNAIDDDINEIEEDYEIISETTLTGYHAQYLDQRDLVYNETTDTYYKTFQKAFSEATNGDSLVTLRNYTNAATTPTVVIPNTSNFTLTIKHIITVNNDVFIENHGNATIQGGSDGTGSIVTFVSGRIIDNYATLTINNLKMSSPKSTAENPNYGLGQMLNNNVGATLNVNGVDMSTVQHTFINNDGTLNVNKYGTASCYNTSRFKKEYVTASCYGGVPIVNNGTANIDYATVNSDTFCKLISNLGNMTINHSNFDQTSDKYKPEAVFMDIQGMDDEIIYSHNGSLTISNSNFAFIPEAVWGYSPDRGGSIYDKESNYINSSNITINNSRFETSYMGFIYAYGGGNITISDSEVHSASTGIIYNSEVNITLNNNTFNTYDSIIDYEREGDDYLGFGDWDYYSFGRLEFKLPHVTARQSTINIDGGTYTSQVGTYGRAYNYKALNDIVYSTKCENGTMDEVEVNSEDIDVNLSIVKYFDVYTNAITSAGELNISNATINAARDVNKKTTVYDNVLLYEPDDIYDSTKLKSGTYGEVATITSFGDTTIVNSTIDSSQTAKPNGKPIPLKTVIMRDENATLTIGTKDSTYDSDLPLIKALDPTPIVANDIELYDGIIKTTSSSITPYLPITDIENGYTLTKDSQNIFLTQENIIYNTTQDIEYNDIQTAINNANNSDVLRFLISYIPTTHQTINIDGKSIVLNLDGKTARVDFNLLNGANLSVMDTGGAGLFDNAIVNDISSINVTGGSGTIKLYDSTSLNISGNSNYDIYANGNATITSNGTTSSAEYTNTNIYMTQNSVLNITDSKINNLELTNGASYTVSCTSDDDVVVNKFINKSAYSVTTTCGTYNEVINDNSTSNTYLTINGGIVKEAYNGPSGTLSINGARIYGSILNNGSLTLTGCVQTSGYIRNHIYTSALAGEGNIVDASNASIVVNSGNYQKFDNYIGTLTINNASTKCIYNSPTTDSVPTLNVLGSSVIENEGCYNSAAIVNYGGIVNIGTKDGNVNTTAPTIKQYSSYIPAKWNSAIYSRGISVNNNNQEAVTNIYDGQIITVKDEGEFIVGLVNDIEPNYTFVIEDIDSDYQKMYLKPISSLDSRVAMVNGINYNSLQQAINKSVLNCTQGSTCPSVTIFLNIELDANLTIESGYSVDIISNGYTISTGNYTVDPNITLDGQPIGNNASGDIINGLRGILGLDDNKANVLVYEMADGSPLNTESHYRLYEFNGTDYELVTMEKGEGASRYNSGKGITNMKPIKGRLYLTSLDPGDYKVVDDNGSELTFTINSDNTLSGHVKEYIPSDSKIEATGEAKLLISIQTGIRRVNYMLIAISLIVVLSTLFVIKRKSQNKNLV